MVTKLMTIDALAESLWFSTRTIKRMVKEGTIPQPVQVWKSRIALLTEDIDAWIQTRERGLRPQPERLMREVSL